MTTASPEPRIDITGAAVDFPIFDAKTRSLKKAVLGRAGGRIGTDSKVPIIEALRDITVSLRQGARVALVGHNGAGKTSLAEALLHRAGATNRLGRVEQGTTVCDHDPEEQRRLMSLGLAIAPFDWHGHRIASSGADR